MKLQSISWLLIAGTGIGSLGALGFTQLPIKTHESVNPIQSTSQPFNTAQDTAPRAQPRQLDVPYVPTPVAVVNEMLRIAKVTSKDIVYDLGSGDGRIVIAAAQEFGARGIGIDIDPERVQEAKQNAQLAGVSDLVQFRQEDLFQTDLSNATVVTLYLLPEINLKLRSKLLAELKPGTRIVSHAFDMGDWKPEKQVEVEGRTIYYWTVPQKAAEATN